MSTLRQLEAKFKRHRPNNAELESFYEQRENEVTVLSQKPVVTADDLVSLDRLGRFRVANELWTKCDQAARYALLHDEHHHVRSAAALAG